jgi:hypothetical protein
MLNVHHNLLVVLGVDICASVAGHRPSQCRVFKLKTVTDMNGIPWDATPPSEMEDKEYNPNVRFGLHLRVGNLKDSSTELFEVCSFLVYPSFCSSASFLTDAHNSRGCRCGMLLPTGWSLRFPSLFSSLVKQFMWVLDIHRMMFVASDHPDWLRIGTQFDVKSQQFKYEHV